MAEENSCFTVAVGEQSFFCNGNYIIPCDGPAPDATSSKTSWKTANYGMSQEDSPLYWLNELTYYTGRGDANSQATAFEKNFVPPQYEQLLEILDAVCQQAPGNAVHWHNEGNVLYQLRRYKEALAAYKKARELAPEVALYWHNEGSALYQLGRYEDALAPREKARELAPEVARHWHNEGNVLYQLRRYKEALAAYKKARELAPEVALYWNNEGTDLNQLRRYKDALAVQEKACKLAPEVALYWNNEGTALYQLGRLEEARKVEELANIIDSDKMQTRLFSNVPEVQKNAHDILALLVQQVDRGEWPSLKRAGEENRILALKQYQLPMVFKSNVSPRYTNMEKAKRPLTVKALGDASLPAEVLDIAARFLITTPDTEQTQKERVPIHKERMQAHLKKAISQLKQHGKDLRQRENTRANHKYISNVVISIANKLVQCVDGDAQTFCRVLSDAYKVLEQCEASFKSSLWKTSVALETRWQLDRVKNVWTSIHPSTTGANAKRSCASRSPHVSSATRTPHQHVPNSTRWKSSLWATSASPRGHINDSLWVGITSPRPMPTWGQGYLKSKQP